MKTTLAITVSLLLALLASACAASTSSTGTQPTAVPPQAGGASQSGGYLQSSATPQVGASSTEVVPQTGVGQLATASGPADVNLGQTASLGSFLVDLNGMTLYLNTTDKPNTNSSVCTDPVCVASWPPLLTSGNPVAGTGVNQALLGAIKRPDGNMQVTYNGWPLYRFNGDENNGDTYGEGNQGAWYVVSPQGEKK